jgi:hypothetical protein
MSTKSLKEKAINIKGKKYVLVSDRIIFFNENYPNGKIETILLSEPKDEMVLMKAIVTPDVEKPARYFTGFSQAKWGDGYINQTSAIENCETSAIGRALAMMGIGVIDSIASVDEIEKSELQAKMGMTSSAIQRISKLLEEKGITQPEEKQKIVSTLADGEKNLNTSAVHRLEKQIELATPEALQIILEG